MFYFYVDESGNRGVPAAPEATQGPTSDWLYVLVAVSLFEHRWHQFEKFLRRRKRDLGESLRTTRGLRLGLTDYEIKSAWVRIPSQRSRRPFLANLSDEQLTSLVDAYYAQLAYHNMHVFAVVVDKRHLRDFMDPVKLHRKATELLLERIQLFMRTEHSKHQALVVADDATRQENLALAEKILYFQEQGTSSGCRLTHISGLPMFTRSEFSNGIQLADLCAYNVYRAFRDGDLNYAHFHRIEDRIWRRTRYDGAADGLKVFPPSSPLTELAQEWQRRGPGFKPGPR